MRFLWVVMACLFDPLLPGVCLHASSHTLFIGPIVFLFLSFIHFYFLRIIVLFPLLSAL